MCWQSKRFYWESAPWRRALGSGSPGEPLCHVARSFMVMGLVSRLSLANHLDLESFLVVHALFSQDGCQWEGFWEVVGHVVSPFDLSQTLLGGGGLLVSCSLPGPSVIKQLLQMLLWCLARVGGFSQCASLTILLFHSTWHPILFSHHHLAPQLLPLGYALHTLLSAIPFPLQWQHYSSVWISLAWTSMLITSAMH